VNPRRLYRSADDRLVAGVASGLAAYLDMDPVIVRVIWFLSILLTGTVTLWLYLIMIVVVPLEPTEWPPQSPWAPGGAPIGSEAGTTPPTADTIPGSATGGAGSGPSATPAAGPSAAFAGTPPPAAGGWWGGDWRAQWRQERWQQRAERDEYRAFGGPGLVFGLMLVLIGGLLCWHQFDPNFDLNRAWPIAIIVFGGILVVSAFRFPK
jgi:phage shock protein C